MIYITGDLSELYNGTGRLPWENASVNKKHSNRMLMTSKLLQLDSDVPDEDRIPMLHELKKFERKTPLPSEKTSEPRKTSKSHRQTGKTLFEGYINHNNQQNCGCTGKPGNLEGQIFYRMKCLNCNYEYEANGCDVWLRKCPKCD